MINYLRVNIHLQKAILLIAFLTTTLLSFAQDAIQGTIVDENQRPMIGVTIQFENTSKGAISDVNGNFKLTVPNSYRNSYLIISYLGYEAVRKPVQGWRDSIKIVMTPDTESLDEVVVSGKSEASVAKETAFKPDVIEMKKLSFNATPVVQLMEMIPGVKLRQNGGLGSDFNLIVNGVSGKGIPVFVDNIPVKLIGDGFQLSNLSADMIQHMEVYKGIVPVKYGADALGGLIAIKTKRQYQKFTDVSYSFGSWNTHQAYLGTQFLIGKNQFIQVDGNYQHSDNSYQMDDVDVTVDDLGNTEKRTVNRFHNDYDSYLGRIQYGFKLLKWADDIRVIFSNSQTNKELQHGVTAIIPWGGTESQSKSYNGILSWSKSFNKDRLSFSAIAGYNFENRVYADTSSYSYSWDGSRVPKTGSKGESGFYANGRLPDIDFQKTFFRFNANFVLDESNVINVTSLNSNVNLEGSDVASRPEFKKDLYTTPQHLFKSYTGISWQSKWVGKITNVLSLKNFRSSSKAAIFNTDFTVDGFLDNVNNKIGFANAVRYDIDDFWYAYLNYERSVRLPDTEEIFGDGLIILPNGRITPEKSHNINVGISKKNVSEFYVGGFYRLISDQIFLNALTPYQTSYVNLRGAKTIGVEIASTIRIDSKWNVYANATYLKTALSEVDPFGKINARHIGSRIPNTPYLFGNLGSSYAISDFLTPESQFTISITNRFLYRYFLGWEDDGIASQKASIPTQLISDLSMTYLFPKEKFSIGLECRNFTDQKAFDNYKVQKSGISFYGKIRMTL